MTKFEVFADILIADIRRVFWNLTISLYTAIKNAFHICTLLSTYSLNFLRESVLKCFSS